MHSFLLDAVSETPEPAQNELATPDYDPGEASSQSKSKCGGHSTAAKRKSKCNQGKTAKKKQKVDTIFSPAAPTDGMMQCIFIENDCIPLWPLYTHRSQEGSFIRVGPDEYWVIQSLVAFRRTLQKGCEPQSKGTTFLCP